MRNKKAFTLVELLAVIIILGILAVLIAPKVVNMINESEKSANMTSAQNIVKAAELKASNNMIENGKNTRINYQTGENTNYLDYSGEKPQIGVVQIKANGEVAMAVKFGDYCYLKEYESNDISTIPYSSETCNQNAEVFINKTIPELAITGDGLYEAIGEPGRYVYRGENPNNYINLKENGVDVTYRIVSYEPDGTIKVVRNESIGEITWDGSLARNTDDSTRYCSSPFGCNAWANQLNTYYNGQTLNDLNQYFYYYYYLNSEATDLTPVPISGTLTIDSEINTYLNNTWINILDFKEHIDTHTFDVGGLHYYSSYRGGDKGIIKEKKEEKLYTWNGKIGLLNITEYAESSINQKCKSVYSNYIYAYDLEGNQLKDVLSSDEWPCQKNNYNYKKYHQWSVTAVADTRNMVWTMSNSFGRTNSEGFINARPALYLKSTTKIGGLGSIETPYYIIEN
jgi:prepilin-type N-terminal cleavage/methylation domain-containing protein